MAESPSPPAATPSSALRITISSLVPLMPATDIAPPAELTVTLLPFARSISPPAKVMAVPTVVKVVVAPLLRSKSPDDITVNVVAPPPKV